MAVLDHQPTPDVYPELLEAGFAETIDSQDNRGGSTHGNANDETVLAGVLTEPEGEGSGGHATDETNSTTLSLNKTIILEGHEPHSERETTKEASETLDQIFKNQGESRDGTGRNHDGNQVGALDAIADRGIDEVEQEHLVH